MRKRKPSVGRLAGMGHTLERRCARTAGYALTPGQYVIETHLPTELVWVHVTLATLTWIATMWAAFAAGSHAPVPVTSDIFRGQIGEFGASPSSRAVSLPSATTLEKGVP
jgi:hypothetical protein